MAATTGVAVLLTLTLVLGAASASTLTARVLPPSLFRRSLGDTTTCLATDPYCVTCTADGIACAQCVAGASVPSGGTTCQGTPLFNSDTGSGAFPPYQGYSGARWTIGGGSCGGSQFCGNGLAGQGSNVQVFSDFKTPLIAAMNGTFDVTHISLGQGSSCYPDVTFTALKAGVSQGTATIPSGCRTTFTFPTNFTGIDSLGMSFSGANWVINQINIIFHYDVNPCDNKATPYCGADAHAICTYGGSSGTASCSCPTDYQMTGSANTTVCTASNLCTTAAPASGPYCGADPQVKCTSTAPFTATCTCNTGYAASGSTNTTVCSPVNVCTQAQPFCADPVATCNYTAPETGTCTCPPGRTTSGTGSSTLCLGRQVFNGDTGNGVFPPYVSYSGLTWTFGSGTSFGGNGLAGVSGGVQIYSDFKTPLIRALNGTIDVTHIQLSQSQSCYPAVTFTGQLAAATKGTVTIPAGCGTTFAFPATFQGIDTLQMSFSGAGWLINQIWIKTNYAINPCNNSPAYCSSDPKAVCTYGGTNNTATCSCASGYYVASGSGSTTTCAVANPCPGFCGTSSNVVCTYGSTPGQATCSCPSGYSMSGTGTTTTCTAVNNCANATPYCGTDSRIVCTSTGAGTSTCTCNDPNYYNAGSASSSVCKPNNPCPSFCGSDTRATCTYANTPGQAACGCLTGYTASGSAPNIVCNGRAVFNGDTGNGVFPPSASYSGLTWTYGSGTSFSGNGLAGYGSTVQVFSDFKNPLFRYPAGVFNVTSITLTSVPYNNCWPDVTFTAYKAGVSMGTGVITAACGTVNKAMPAAFTNIDQVNMNFNTGAARWMISNIYIKTNP